MDVHHAADRWNGLLERTFLLWEECRKLREEAEGATEVRGGSFPMLRKVAEYAGVLEAGLRRARDDVATFHRGGGQLTVEEWLRRTGELLGPEEGPEVP
jgi:hypothetical protein